MWPIITMLLLVSATSASAQWQTRVDVIMYSIKDADYTAQLRLARTEAKERGDVVGVAKMDFLLSQPDPAGYKEFVLSVNKKIGDWVTTEVEKGESGKLHGKFASVIFSPYSLNAHKEVQIMVIQKSKPVETGVNIGDGVDKVFNLIKNMILDTPAITPTSRRSA